MSIYADNAATTKPSEHVISEMVRVMRNAYGNPSSIHSMGGDALDELETARKTIADILGCTPSEIVFTSGGSEADNQAIISSVYTGAKAGKKHIVSTAFEHHAVLHTLDRLREQGFDVTLVPVNENGIVKPEDIENAIRDDTALVSVMYANNEIGTIQPIFEIGEICHKHGVLFHVDATQAIGKLHFDMKNQPIDLMSMSSHKVYGPKGMGALYVRRKPRVRIECQIDGGGHERGMRSGTLATQQIVGMGEAYRILKEEMDEENERIRKLRDRLWEGIQKNIPCVVLNGSWEHRVGFNLNVSFEYIEGESLMMACKNLAVSSGSACTSASLEPSFVLKALGRPDELAHSSIRFTLGRFTTEEEIDYTIKELTEAVTRLRELSPLWEMHQKGIDTTKVQWAKM